MNYKVFFFLTCVAFPQLSYKVFFTINTV